MAQSDSETDTWKASFPTIPVFYSFCRHHHQGGDHWRHDADQESDITFVLEIDSCESNGVVRFQNGHMEGTFSIIPSFYSFRRNHRPGAIVLKLVLSRISISALKNLSSRRLRGIAVNHLVELLELEFISALFLFI